ncbi:Uncharacterized protein BM_BM1097 [Brugia malayi]|uniref:Bm1097, isoform a n=1 Tax=Brugia malayi TaxID=6279 RepID=A0A0J9Y7D3_BRUMA|nr:Uncharacterized protein BM_BM1097 [Brugia malayi]CDQ03262.1 Bm1097, isoform b [Brugia malayi]VIO88274.1 Uncharacterized protein BM_BM1097 [Brugia malayi]
MIAKLIGIVAGNVRNQDYHGLLKLVFIYMMVKRVNQECPVANKYNEMMSEEEGRY